MCCLKYQPNQPRQLATRSSLSSNQKINTLQNSHLFDGKIPQQFKSTGSIKQIFYVKNPLPVRFLGRVCLQFDLFAPFGSQYSKGTSAVNGNITQELIHPIELVCYGFTHSPVLPGPHRIMRTAKLFRAIAKVCHKTLGNRGQRKH